MLIDIIKYSWEFFIFFATGFIYFISNQTYAFQIVNKCGGLNTEIQITQKQYRPGIGILSCNGQQIHSHAVIVPAYCIDGVGKENLLITKKHDGSVVNYRPVTYIFIHSFYSRCSAEYDLAVLAFDEAFDTQYDVICLENPNLINSDERRECHSQRNSYDFRKQHYNSNGITEGQCLLSENLALFQSEEYFTEFDICLFHPDQNSRVVKSLYGYHFQAIDELYKDPKLSSSVKIEFKLYDAKDWLDEVLQYVISVSLLTSITSEEENTNFED